MSVVIGQLEDRVTGTECKTVLIRRYLGVGNPREINAEDMKRANKLREGITVLFRAEWCFTNPAWFGFLMKLMLRSMELHFKIIYKFKMIFWLHHLVWLRHGKYDYKQLHMAMALQPAAGQAWGISSNSHWSGQEVSLNKGSEVPVIRRQSSQRGDVPGENPCIWRLVKNTTHSTCSISQLRARWVLDTLHPVPFLHLCFVSDV